jgi:6-phosphogluconolactonase
MTTITRRRFLASTAALSLVGPRTLFGAPKQGAATLFIGNGGAEGIFSASWNAFSGEPGPLELAAACDHPGFLALSRNGRNLYAGGNTKAPVGTISSFAREGSKLTLLNQTSSGGQNPCHLALSQNGWAFAANYGSGQWLATRILADGRLSDGGSIESPVGHGPNANRQDKSHTHWTTMAPNGHFVYVNDLGSDRIWLHTFSPAAGPKLLPEQSYAATPGSGPRTLHFHPRLPLAYAVHELDSSIVLLSWNATTGELKPLERYALLPEGYTGSSAGCDLAILRDARHLYAINRGNNFVATFSVDGKTGRLTLLERSDCGGKTPRHLALDPTERWLLIANQDSGSVAILPRDPATGRLGKVAQTTTTPTPMCLLFG